MVHPHGLLFDLDGVIYNGDEALPGAAAVVDRVRRANMPFRFLTNTTSRPRSALVEKLARMNIPARVEEIITPAVAAQAWLTNQGRGGRIALFVPEITRKEFEGLDLAPAGSDGEVACVVIGDLGDGWNFSTLNRAFRLLHSNPKAELLALGKTRYWCAEDGLRLDAGPFVAALEYACGRPAIVTGKPSPQFFQTAVNGMALEEAEVLMIGDDIETDVCGAQQAGLKAALVKTGKFQPADLEGDVTPDLILDSLGDLLGEALDV